MQILLIILIFPSFVLFFRLKCAPAVGLVCRKISSCCAAFAHYLDHLVGALFDISTKKERYG